MSSYGECVAGYWRRVFRWVLKEIIELYQLEKSGVLAPPKSGGSNSTVL